MSRLVEAGHLEEGKHSTPELSSMAVFDGKCARSYLDSEQDVAYLPYGLDILENLGKLVLPTLGQRLAAEINALNTDTTAFADFPADTAVGKLIAGLNSASDPVRITKLGTLSPAETARIAVLGKLLSRASRKRRPMPPLLAQRLKGLVCKIDLAFVSVDDASVTRLGAVDASAQAAASAESAAAAAFQSSEALLAGTGGQAWKLLFDAARRYSIESATRRKHSRTSPRSKVSLCQARLTRIPRRG